MRHIMTIACAAALVSGAMPGAMQAQEQPLTLSAALTARPEQPPPRARALLRAGDRHRQAFRLRAAERAYSEASRLDERAGRLPAEALWSLAAVQHSRHRWGAAARTLDRLAALAERYGDPAAKARALLEATILHYKAGDPARARRSLVRLLPLRSSPHLPPDLRRQIETRLIR